MGKAEVTTVRKWKIALYKDKCKKEDLELFLGMLPKSMEVDDIFDVKVVENENNYIISFNAINSTKVERHQWFFPRLETYFLNEDRLEETSDIVHLLKHCNLFGSCGLCKCKNQKLFLVA